MAIHPVISGYSSSLPSDVLLGSMVIYIDGTAAYGATQGEPTVNLPREWQSLPFDGSLSIPKVGLIRKMWSEISIEGTFIEMNATKMADLEPGATTASSGGIDTVAPMNYGEFVPAGGFKENVRAVMRRASSTAGIVAIEFNYGIIQVTSLGGSGMGNGTVQLKFVAVQASADAVETAPYSIKMAAGLSVITGVDG